MRTNAIRRYCKEVNRQLICLPKTRQELMSGLCAELEELPSEQTETLDRLENCFGELSQTVLELQDAVPAWERTMALRFQRRRRLLAGIATGSFILILILFIFFLLHHEPFFITTGPAAYGRS